jgi:ABC-type transport system involved in multi-copper enzyme maturation permease subunit
MVWIALILLAIMAAVVGLITAAGRWAPDFLTQRVVAGGTMGLLASPGAPATLLAASASLTGESGALIAFSQFSRSVVFEVLLGFLLPIWSLSFATQALGNDREERSLVWLLTRPLSRPAVYLAKFVAVLPWSLGLNVGGFGVLCLAAGVPGKLAFYYYWPAVFLGTLAYCALFHLIGAYFRRPSVVAIVYTFFLETFVGGMPGHMKRISISFYNRCLMLDAAEAFQLPPPARPSVYLPVGGTTAWMMLLSVTVVLLVLGMCVFARTEYHDLT